MAGGTYLFAIIIVAVLAQFMESFPLSLVMIGFLSIPFGASALLVAGMMRGLKKTVLGQVPEQVLRPAIFLALLVGAYFFSDDTISAKLALSFNVLAIAAVTVIAAWQAWRYFAQYLFGAQGAAFVREEQRSAWLASILPLALIGGLSTINKQADILVLGFFEPTEKVGIYQIAARGALLVSFLLLSVNLVIGPHLAHLYKQRRREEVQALLTKASRIILGVSIVPAGALIVYGKAIITFVFGAEYSSGADAMAILCIGVLVNCATGPLIVMLNMTGHENGTLRGVAIGAASNVCLNFLLVPRFGMNGAAIATAATYLIWNSYLWWFCRSKLGFDTSAIGLPLLASRENTP